MTLLFEALKNYYQFRHQRNYQESEKHFEPLFRSQLDSLYQVCKDLALNEQMTVCIQKHVEAQYREEITEFGVAAEQIKAWTLSEFQVDP